MKMKAFSIFLAIFVLTGCAPYSHKVFKARTGMEFGKGVNLCSNVPVKDAKSCEPTGVGWEKGKKITSAQLSEGDKVFMTIDNNYLLQLWTGNKRIPVHSFDLYNSTLNNPKSKITVEQDHADKVVTNDFVLEFAIKKEIAEIYEKEAIEKAVNFIELAAKTSNVEVSAEFISSVRSNLQKEIKNKINTKLTSHYVIAEYIGKLSEGEEDSNFAGIAEMNPSIEELNSGNKIITGISGFVFSKYESNQTVFEESMLKNSIDIAVKSSGFNNIKFVDDLKVNVTSEWSNEINKKINTDIVSVESGIHFYPLWFKTTRKATKN